MRVARSVEQWDVVVVGAGPAGAVLARELALAGARVLVVERGELGRDKPCGEGLMPKGVRALVRAGLGHLLEGTPRFDGIRFHVGERSVAGRFHDGAGRGVRRDRFDEALGIAAVTAGASLRTGAMLRAIARDDAEGWRLGIASAGRRRGEGEIVRARFLVGADGVGSRVRRALGLDRPPRRVGRSIGPGLRVVDGDDGPRRAAAPTRAGGPSMASAASVASGADVDGARVGVIGHVTGRLPLPRFVDVFYEAGWEIALTPLPCGQLSVAALVEPWRTRELAVAAGADGSRGRHGAAPARWLAARIAEADLPIDPPDARSVRCVRLGAAATRTTAPGALLVGDAAGAVDPIVGCGISHAIAAAPLAAQAILGALALPDAASRLLEGYERAQRRLVRDGSWAAELALLLARHRTVGAAVARLAPRPLIDGLVGLVGD